jgi:calcineurin-like phosphoesterase family protein
MKTVFISDTHLNHINIVKGVSKWSDTSRCRPFNTVAEHNETILDGINTAADVNDRLIINGDFCFGNHENIPKFRNLIRCRNVWLVKGNHDRQLWKYHRSVFQYTDKYIDDLVIDKQQIFMCHYAGHVWEDNNRGSWMLCGHSHGNLPLPHSEGKILDLCPENHNYKPWTFEQIKEYMDARPIVAKDHH